MAWDVLPGAPTPEEHAALHSTNSGVIAFLLHDVELEATQRTSDERMVDALAPIHAKLDLIVQLLGRVRYGHAAPPAREIEFALDRIAWSAPEPLQSGGWVRLRLYFHPIFLEPVQLHGHVSDCHADGEGGYRTEVLLASMPEAHDTALARLAFLTHRRQQAKPTALGVSDA